MPDTTEIINSVQTLPDRIAAEIDGLDDRQLRWRPSEGEWSIKEVCGHLLDDSEVWRRRLLLMVTQENPTLPTYEQENLVRERAYQDAEINSVLAEFKRYRGEIAQQLRALTPAAWERVGQHPERGPRTIRAGMELMVEHTEGHLRQVRELKARAAV
jgi:uncharacterized damage-inducible protein DinB